ncbi:hypothetical protein [Streptomyces sp. HB2AG]|uniref:hypothetical protein n=1 Tax=Streptomyces sp. HB2AG TaxID=2983400 RepID=UPI0022AA2919|nr:hypothetical protein [Streptomyces sp. HB2AG]MCZ2524479.1 hypothetical protein [Streptomyces sp. HB2AG]
MAQHVMSSSFPAPDDPESLDELVGDCRRMAPRWTSHAPVRPVHSPPSHIHGVTVPEKSAHLLDGMSDYGD